METHKVSASSAGRGTSTRHRPKACKKKGRVRPGRDQFDEVEVLRMAGIDSRKIPTTCKDAAATAYTDSQGIFGAVVAVNSWEQNNIIASVVGLGQRLQAGLSKQVQPDHNQMRCVNVGVSWCCEDIPR